MGHRLQVRPDTGKLIATGHRSLHLAIILLVAVLGAVLAAMALMHAPQADLQLLTVFLLISGAISLVLGGAVVRWLGLRQATMRARLALASTAGLLVALLNVLATSALMFLSPHDLALLLLLLAFAAVISLGFGFVTAGTLSAELEQVSRTAERLAQGDLEARVGREAVGRDEAARLGRVFDDMANRLQHAFERQRALEQDRRELVAAVSHDLRTPLATTRAMVEAITDGVVTEPGEIQRYLHLIGREIQHLSGLIDDMFEMSLIESGLLTLRLQALPPAEVIESVTAAYQTRASAACVQLECATGAEMDSARIMADTERLQRVLRNLLDNALRHTPPGGLVRVEAGLRKQQLIVTVSDSGPGIPADKRERIFERSFQGARAPRYTEAVAQGNGNSGLGLAISRGLVEAHSGRIWAEASPSGGASLRFTLPLVDG